MTRRESARVRDSARRRRRRTLLAVALPAVLLLAALGASSVLARPAGDGSVAMRVAEREERRQALRAEREAERRLTRAAREQKARERIRRAAGKKERPNAAVQTSCSRVTIRYFGFPDMPGNTVTETIKVVGRTFPRTTLVRKTFVFDGPGATDSIPITPAPGKYQIDALATWKTNGLSGHFAVPDRTRCLPAPGFAVEKLQRIDGDGGEYTPGTLTGAVGQTIDYAIVVRNTGNVPVTLSGFSDSICDAGPTAGGAPANALGVGASATYTCTHVVTPADKAAGSVANTASVTGNNSPPGQGLPINHVTNTVFTVVEKATPGPGPGATSSPGTGTAWTPGGVASTTGSSSGVVPHFGVLALTQTTPPSLLGPHGCVRSNFRASLRAKGVANVAFYLDGHLIRKLTARGARRGQLTISINASKLKVGPHRLVAKIVMARASSTAKAVRATRSLTFVRCASAAIRPKFAD